MDQDKLFPTLSAAQIARIAAHGRRRAVESGDVLYDVGDRSAACFVVVSGAIQVLEEELGKAESPDGVAAPDAFDTKQPG